MVSIIIPCYNHEKYISDCLQSVINQTYKDIEVIICDDCSKDNSFDIIKSWEKKLRNRFKNVIIYQNEINLGVTKNLNEMIKRSQGDYIKSIASDDMLTPDAINILIKGAEENPGFDIYFSNMVFIPQNTKYSDLDIKNYKLNYNEKPLDGRNLIGEICASNYIVAPGVLLPRETIVKYGLFDEKYCLEDFEYWLRISVNGALKYIDGVTAIYRECENSLSRFDTTKKSKERHRKFHNDIMDIFQTYKQYASVEQIAAFYNNRLSSAIGVNDKKVVKSIVMEMKREAIKIDTYNKLRLPLIVTGIYPVFKMIKNKRGY